MTVLFVGLLSAGLYKSFSGNKFKREERFVWREMRKLWLSYSLFGVAIYLASYTFWRELKILILLDVMFKLIVKADVKFFECFLSFLTVGTYWSWLLSNSIIFHEQKETSFKTTYIDLQKKANSTENYPYRVVRTKIFNLIQINYSLIWTVLKKLKIWEKRFLAVKIKIYS